MGLTEEAALAVAGVALAGPPLVNLILVVAKQIYAAAQHHIHLKDRIDTCQRLLTFCKGETTDLLTWFSGIWVQLPQPLQDQIRSISDILLGLYVDVAKLFPAASISGLSSVPGNSASKSQISTAKLSWHNVERIEKTLATIEQWNGRLHVRALEVLFFTPLPAPSDNAQAEITRRIDTIDRVHKIRNAVYSSLHQSEISCSPVLLPDEQGIGPPQPIVASTSNAATYRLDVPSVGIVFVETRHYSDDANDADIERLHRSVRDIASILRHARPETMGILACRGFKHVALENKFELHFLSPRSLTGEQAQSLRSLLKTVTRWPVRHDLRSRLDVARSLAI